MLHVPSIAQLVERRTVETLFDILRSLVRIRLEGDLFLLFVVFFAFCGFFCFLWFLLLFVVFFAFCGFFCFLWFFLLFVVFFAFCGFLVWRRTTL